jgi:hypothetical protein
MPLFSKFMTRSTLKAMLADELQVRLYWRVLTPMVILWGFIFQRLSAEHSCDAYVDYLHSGGADELDLDDPHQEPLSKRLCSESTSAYVQGRNRLPLKVIERARQVVYRQIESWLGGDGRWKGHRVRLLDGTTLRLRPYGDLAETYGQSRNQHGSIYWVVARAVAAFDLFSQATVGTVEGPVSSSETHMVWDLLQQETEKGSIYIGDRNFGIYAVLQAMGAAKQACILRLTKERYQARLRRANVRSLRSGQSLLIGWKPTRKDKTLDHLPTPTIAGRLMYIRLTKPGFRPTDIYLFTTLLDDERYPLTDLVALYGHRWQVEVDFRHIKTTMHMEFFNVQSAALFRKELAAGLLAFNLVCALMTKASKPAHLKPAQLSFSRCLRRVRHFLLHDLLPWPDPTAQESHLLERLAKCKLAIQPNKTPFEPRKVRSRPRPYPPLRGSRDSARKEVLLQFAIS